MGRFLTFDTYMYSKATIPSFASMVLPVNFYIPD